MEYIKYVLSIVGMVAPFLITACFTIAARLYGLKAIFPTILSTAVVLVLMSINVKSASANSWIATAAMSVAGIVAGIIYFLYVDRSKNSESLRKKIDYYRENKQYVVVASAFGLAIAITPMFSFLVNWEKEGGFWYGFYQSWTSGLVAFLFLGVAGILVSVYRPSQEQFKKRVSHLFNVNDNAAIDFLASSVQGAGYYATKVNRTYTVESYSEEHKAYKITVKHESVHKNFLWDVSVPDKAIIKLIFEDADIPVPPISIMGSVISVRINGDERVTRPIAISDKGIDESWPYNIPAGGEGVIVTVHNCYFKAGEPHSFGVNRFARQITSKIVYNCVEGGLPDITIQAGGAVRTERLTRGHPTVMAEATDYIPGAYAFEFTLSEPS